MPEAEAEYAMIKGIDKINYRYYPTPLLYEKLKKFVHESNYDYFILYTNDTVVKQENVDRMLFRLETGVYKVISGVMNVDEGKYKDCWSATYNLPSLEIKDRYYDFIAKEDYGLTPVKFVGKSLLAIRRDVLEGFDWGYDKHNLGSNDLYFAHYCDKNDITILADTGNSMEHKRGKFKTLVGINEPNYYLRLK